MWAIVCNAAFFPRLTTLAPNLDMNLPDVEMRLVPSSLALWLVRV